MKKGVMFVLLSLAVAILVCSISLNGVSALTNVSICGKLSTANEYYALNQSINSSVTCLNITANNITLDCSYYGTQYYLNGTRATTTYGIWLSGRNGTIIKNCLVENFGYGIYTISSTFGSYLNSNVTNDVKDGISFSSSSNNNTIMNNSISRHGYGADTYAGIYLSGSSYNNISGNNLSYSGRAAVYILSSSNRNNILNNTISYTWGHGGVYISSGTYNTISNNFFYNDTEKALETGTSSSYTTFAYNTISANSTESIYIYSNYNNITNNTMNGSITDGIYINGNHSSFINNIINSSGGGISLLHATNNTFLNNIITVAIQKKGFDISGSSYAEYRQSINSTNTVNGLSVMYYDGVYTPCPNNTAVSLGSSYSFIGFLGCNNVTFTDTTATNGISLAFITNSNMANLNSSYTYDGLVLKSSSNNIFTNCTANNNYQYGFYAPTFSSADQMSSNNSFTNCTANNNQYGFSFDSESNDSFVNNTANNNAYGFYLSASNYDSLFNSFMNCTANNNSYGFYFDWSSNNLLVNNTANNNSYGFYLGGSSNNTITQNQIMSNNAGSIGIYVGDGYGLPSNYSMLSGNTIATTGSTSYAVYLNNSYWNVFDDSILSASYTGVADIYVEGAGISNFTNCSFDKSDTSFKAGATASINIFWYLDAYVNDSNGNAIGSANITSTTTGGTLTNWSLTNSSGYISRLTLREYMQNITSIYFDTDYNLSASKTDYTNDSKQVNLTGNKITYDSTHIVLTLTDNSNPIASFGTNPIDSYNSSDSSVMFDMKCSNNLAVHTIQLWGNWTGIWQANYSNASYTNNTWLNITVSGIPSGQNFKWAVWCNDTAGLTNMTENRTFTVDTTAPTITLPAYTNATKYTNASSMIFNISVVDAEVGASYCSIGVSSKANLTVAVSSGWCNGTYSLSGVGDGNQTMNVYANDTLGNTALNNSYVVWVDSTAPVADFGTNSVDNYNDTDGSIVFDFKCSDNTAVQTIQLWTNTTGSWQANYTNSSYVNNTWLNISVTGVPQGVFKWGIYCNDSVGNFDWSDTNRTLGVDSTAPTITLPVYSNATLKKNTDTLILNISVADANTPQSPCFIDVNTTNQTITYSDGWCNGTVSLSGLTDGNKTIKVYENDSFGNRGSNDSYVVWIDNTTPTITHNFPSNNSYYSYAPYFNGTCTDSGSGVSTIWTNTTEYPALDISSPYNFTNTSALTEKVYLVKIYCNDTLNNTATELFNFTYDTQDPEINLINPKDNHEFASGTTSITFQWDVTDNLDSNMSCNLHTQGEYKETVYCENDTTCKQTVSGFSVRGSYNWIVNCSDGLNQNVSESRNFVILHSPSWRGGSGGSSQGTANATNDTEPSDYNSSLDNLNESKSAGVGSEVINPPNNTDFIKSWGWVIGLIVLIGIVVSYFIISATTRKKKGY